jgi:phage shock protein PspC (stress-responsive transcriptional regulator)
LTAATHAAILPYGVEEPSPEERTMKRYKRSRKERKIAGVCGGLAELFDWDPTLVRLAFVLLVLPTGIFPLLLVYAVAWAIVPEAEKESGSTSA